MNKVHSFGDPENHPAFSGRDQSQRAIFDADTLKGYTSQATKLLGTRRARFERGPNDLGLAVAPGVNSGDNRFPRLINKMVGELQKEVAKPDIVNGSLTSPGFLGDLSRLRTQAGFGMDPYPCPELDNSAIQPVQQWKSDRDEKLFNILMESVYQWKPKDPFRLARPSSTGVPHWTRNMAIKLQGVNSALDNVDTIHQLAASGELAKLADDLAVYFVYNSSWRHQADSWTKQADGFRPKPRPAMGFKYSTTADATNPTADRGIANSSLARTRVRFVYALSSSIASLLGCIATGYRSHYLKEYAFTWKHRGPSDIQRKVEGHNLVATDVSQWDTMFPTLWSSGIFDHIAKQSPKAADLMRLAYMAPLLLAAGRNDDPDFQWFATGHPFELDTFNLSFGLPSGHPLSPDMSKSVGPLDPIRALAKLGILDETDRDEVQTFLRGEHPDAIHLNMGDDQLTGVRLGCKKCPSRDALAEALMDDPYMPAGIEEPTGFLGNTLLTIGEGKYKAVPVLDSYVEKFWVPEASISSPKRPFPAIGWKARQDHYAVLGNAFGVTRDVVARNVRDVYGLDIEREFASLHDREVVKARLSGFDLSGLPAHLRDLILTRPDRLWWDESIRDQLTPEVFDRVADFLTASIQPGVIESKLSAFMGVNLSSI